MDCILNQVENLLSAVPALYLTTRLFHPQNKCDARPFNEGLRAHVAVFRQPLLLKRSHDQALMR